MRKMLSALRDVASLAFGLAVLAVICLGWAPFAWVLDRVRFDPSGRTGRRANTLCLRSFLWTLQRVRAMRFDISALDALEGQEPLIIAPNHPRLLDAFLVISRLPNVVCIMKKDIKDNVFLGHGARLARYIGNDSPTQMIRDSIRTLAQGNHLLLFPEGTRTVREPVNPMTGAVGLIAARAGVPVQTVIIECDSPYLRKGSSLFQRPALPITYRVRLGRRFDPPQDTRAFAPMLEQYFIEELSAGTPMVSASRVREAVVLPQRGTVSAGSTASAGSSGSPASVIESHPT
jgi:1-acyl-sn-glycerol-3-phosphate acyltransferase